MSAPLPRLIAIVGPTASGKSTLAAQLARAIVGEVVSADSVQVYRYFDIGSGKVTAKERSLAPHHLIDCADAHEPIEANVWAEMAREKIAEIFQRGAVPIVCGGTFLWLRALLFGLAEAPPGDSEIRERHRDLIARHGRSYLHRELSRVDAKSALRLHENDSVRVSRALEVHELTGRPLSEIQEEHGFASPRYDYQLLAIDWPAEEYEQRLQQRVRDMMSAGLVAEVRDLIHRGYGKTRAMGTVGYKQVHAALTHAEVVDEELLVREIVRVSRIFARRQRTWLKKEEITLVSPRVLADSQALVGLAQNVGFSSRISAVT
jgi:tRNA dimethylallyltransferase